MNTNFLCKAGHIKVQESNDKGVRKSVIRSRQYGEVVSNFIFSQSE